MKKNRRVMVFGVFDRLHDGHRSFLKQAEKRGSELIVVVARDVVVRELKNKIPQQNERQRATALRRVPDVWKVVLGDKLQGSYGVIKKWKPDVICVGYDQKDFERDIRKKMRSDSIPRTRIVCMRAKNKRQWHTSLLGLPFSFSQSVV